MSGRFVSVVSLFCEENENHKDTMTTVSVATTIATLATRLLLQLLWCFAGMIRRFVSFHHVYSFRHHLDIVAQENVGICSEIDGVLSQELARASHSRKPGSLTRDSRVSVVSLEIPGIVVSLEIPVFRIFLVKISGKIVKISFLDSRDQNKILKF